MNANKRELKCILILIRVRLQSNSRNNARGDASLVSCNPLSNWLSRMQPAIANENRPLPAWKSPWVIGWLALVMTVLVVNALMVYLAVTTNPGLVVEDYYERGQAYERTMHSRSTDDPGWVMRADIPKDISAGETSPIRFFLVDEAGQPVIPESVELFVYRPSDATRDFSVPMMAEGPGRYMAQVSFPLVGVWDTLVAARRGDDEYHVGQRIEVRRP